MDDELQKLEDELKRLRPARVPAGLVARVAGELGPTPVVAAPPRPAAVIRWGWLAALPAAAAVLLLLYPGSRHPVSERPLAGAAPAPASEAFKPVAAENVLYATEDEGIVTLDDGRPARRERLHYVDTVTWRNPRTNASLTWSVPREEVRIVPVNFQ